MTEGITVPIVLVIANQKGGCGKTTTVMNLAGGLAAAKYRVLVVDADPQATATIWSLAEKQGSLPFDVFTARQLGGQFSRLSKLDYDLILVDTPPGVAAESSGEAARFVLAAIGGADAILVPLKPSPADFAASRQLVRFLAKVRPGRVKLAVLVNGMKNNSISRESRDQAAKDFAPLPGAFVLETTIGDRTAIVEVTGSGQTIFDFKPKHRAAFEYAALTKEIIQWLVQPHSSPRKV